MKLMSDDLVRLRSFNTTYEADLAKAALESSGIRSYTDGVGMSLIYGGAIGAVDLNVSRNDFEMAHEIIENLEIKPLGENAAWFCGDCNVDVDAGYGVCWSCGKPESEVGTESPHLAEATEFAPTAPSIQPSDQPSDPNPYAAPSEVTNFSKLEADEETTPIAPTTTVEFVQRAYRCAILGLFLIPMVLNFYSMFLLLRASPDSALLPGKLRKRFYITFFINLFSGLFWPTFFIWFL